MIVHDVARLELEGIFWVSVMTLSQQPQLPSLMLLPPTVVAHRGGNTLLAPFVPFVSLLRWSLGSKNCTGLECLDDMYTACVCLLFRDILFTLPRILSGWFLLSLDRHEVSRAWKFDVGY